MASAKRRKSIDSASKKKRNKKKIKSTTFCYRVILIKNKPEVNINKPLENVRKQTMVLVDDCVVAFVYLCVLPSSYLMALLRSIN